jgi:hypothetical protein
MQRFGRFILGIVCALAMCSTFAGELHRVEGQKWQGGYGVSQTADHYFGVKAVSVAEAPRMCSEKADLSKLSATPKLHTGYAAVSNHFAPSEVGAGYIRTSDQHIS